MSTTLIIPLPPETTVRSYNIIIGQGLLPQLGRLIMDQLGHRRCFVISDLAVAAHYMTQAEDSLAKAGHTLGAPIIFREGEAQKTLTTLSYIFDHLLNQQPDRHSLVIALGGGVVGDIAGLAASLTLRGIDFVQVPTTLLAMVDSSVGGKTAVDHACGKNLIGAFYQPRLVLADTDLLKSLPPREWRAGYAEIVKYGLIMNAEFYNWCENYADALLTARPEVIQHAVHESCRMKAQVVAADEKEQGQRAILNFGHTFGHAFETYFGYGRTLNHGEAVAIGMVHAAQLSAKMGLCDAEIHLRIKKHLDHVGLPTRCPEIVTPDMASKLITLMLGDKKSRDGQLNLVLLKGIGQAVVQKNVPADMVKDVLLS